MTLVFRATLLDAQLSNSGDQATVLCDLRDGRVKPHVTISVTVSLTRPEGHRVVRGGSEHYRTIEALERNTLAAQMDIQE